MNIVGITESLKQMPDADIQRLMQAQSPEVPSWALMTEINRRNRTRQGQQTGTGAPPTVAEQLTRQISQQQPTPTQIPQPGAQSQPRGLSSMMAQGAPKGYAAGGIVAFADGGVVRAAQEQGYLGSDEEEAKRWLETMQPYIKDEADKPSGVKAIQAAQAQRSAADVPWLSRQRATAPAPAPAPAREIATEVPPIGDVGLFPLPSDAEPAPNWTPTATILSPERRAAFKERVAQQQAETQPKTPPGAGQAQQRASTGIGAIGGVQIDPNKMRLPQQRPELDVMTEAAKRAAYYGEDEYGKAVAADLESRRAEAAKSRGGLDAQTWIDLGLGAMTAGGESGATFLGSLGKAGKEALAMRREREKGISAEEAGIRQAGLAEVGRKQTEKRAGITEAITAKDVRESENLKALEQGNELLNRITVKNVELKQDMIKANANIAAEVKRFEHAEKTSNTTAMVASLNAMNASVDDAYKALMDLKETPKADPGDVARASAAYKNAVDTRDKLAAKMGGVNQETPAPTGKPRPHLTAKG